MRLRWFRLAVALGLLICAPRYAAAANWQLVAATDDASVYIDVGSLSTHGRYLKAWFMWDYKAEQTPEFNPSKKFRSAKVLQYFNCAEKSWAQIQAVMYTGQAGTGDLASNFSIPMAAAQFADVVPDSVGETMEQYVCARQAKSNR